MITLGGLFLALAFLVLLSIAVGLAAVRWGRTVPPDPIRAKAWQIARDFPDQVHAWGGPKVLEDPRAVQAIRRRLDPTAAEQDGSDR
jgi:hypothetical protein